MSRYLSPEPLLQDPAYVSAMAERGMSVPTYAYALNNPQRYVDPDGRNPLWLVGIYSAASAYFYGDEVLDISRDAAKRARASGLGGERGGYQDALRHCIWQCQVTQDLPGGAAAAWAIGYLHELKGQYVAQDNSDADREMDFHNNQCGRDIGKNEYKHCRYECNEALIRGDLISGVQ